METTDADHDADDTARRAAIEARIESYAKPTSLRPEVAARVLPRLKELVRLAEPTTPDDAKDLLAAGCRLIADTVADVHADIDVDAVLSEEAVARWSHAAKRARMNPGTLANALRFQNRLVRARNGLPSRRATRRTRVVPVTLLDSQPLHDLAAALADIDPVAATALVAAAGAGLLATSEPVAVSHGDAPVAMQGDHAVAVNASWHDLARRLAPATADPDAWSRLRAAAAATGMVLTHDALRLRWAVDTALATPTPQVTVQAGIPRRLLDHAIAHLPPTDDDTARTALRG